jgi:hypothetical protein
MNTTLPTTPGAFLGYRKNGTPFFLAAGGAPGDEETLPEGTPAPPETPPATPQAGETPAASPEPASGQEPQQPAGDDPEKTARTVAAIREEYKQERAKRQAIEKTLDGMKAAAAKAEADQAARNKALAVALGIAQEDVTPEQLAERAQLERDAARAEATTHAAQKRAADVELAVLRSAYASGVNGNALLDSRAFVATVTGLDPAAEDFGARVTEAIEAAVTANPGYKAAITPVPAANPLAPPAAPAPPAPTIPRSGGEFNGAPGGQRQLTEEDAARMSPAEVWDAMKNGLFAGEGFAKPKSKRY